MTNMVETFLTFYFPFPPAWAPQNPKSQDYVAGQLKHMSREILSFHSQKTGKGLPAG